MPLHVYFRTKLSYRCTGSFGDSGNRFIGDGRPPYQKHIPANLYNFLLLLHRILVPEKSLLKAWGYCSHRITLNLLPTTSYYGGPITRERETGTILYYDLT